jgi:hypothetical protein
MSKCVASILNWWTKTRSFNRCGCLEPKTWCTMINWLRRKKLLSKRNNLSISILTPKGLKAIFRPFLKFGQAIVKAIFIKNSWIKLWIGGLVLASRRTKFYKISNFVLVIMSQNEFFFSIWAAKKLFIIKFF